MKKLLLGACLLASTSTFAADVQISQFLDSPDPATRGGDITYTISLLNGEANTASDVTLTLPIPATTSFVSVDDGNCVHDGGTPGTVNCNFGDITGDGLGSPVTTVNVVVKTSAPTGNTVAVSATVGTSSIDNNPGNDTASQNTTIDNGADLSINHSDSADPVIAGGTFSYILSVLNSGPNDANGITLTDTLPAGVSYTSFNGVGWTCNNAGQVVTCTLASITNGATSADVSINVKVDGAISGTITNSATVSATSQDPNSNNNTSTENTLINVGTDLSLSKSVASPVIGATTTTFTLSPRNLGPFNAANVTVSDTLPAGFTYINATGTGWACSETTGTVSCTRAAYNVGATDDIQIQTNVPASGSNITNSATFSSATTPDPDNSNNTGSVTFSVVPDGADLSITKTKTPDPVAQGQNMTSSIRVTNSGPQATSGTITVTDTLDTDESFVSYSGTNWQCNHGAGIVTCEYLSGATPIVLANGASTSTLSIVSLATITGNASDILTNTACVSDVAGQPDGAAGNDCASASATSTQDISDLAIVKTASTAGGVNSTLETNENQITYQLTVTNNGPNLQDGNNTNAVVITDNIPGYVTGVVNSTPANTGVSVVENTGSKFTCTTGSTVSCVLNAGQTMANAEVATFTITVDRPLSDGALTNTATVRSEALGDNNSSNNSSSAPITIDPIADVEVQSIVITSNPTKVGTNATYVVTFRNNGPSTASNVNLSHVFTPDAGKAYSLISASPTKGTCGALAGNTLTCNIGSLNRNETQTLTMVVRPTWDASNSPWTLANTSSITTSTAESDGTNNSKSENLSVVLAELDLLVNTTDVLDPVGWTPTPVAFPGSNDNVVIYQVDTTNRGPSVASNVIVANVLTPKNGQQLTFLCDDAGSASCAVGTSICSNTGTTATGPTTITSNCSLPNMESDTTTSRYLFFLVDSAPDSLGDTVSIASTVSSNEDDTNALNDTESENTSVRVRVDIAVVKTPSTPTVSINEPFNWSIVVSNAGPGDSANSNISDTLPANMTLTGTPSATQGSCTGVATDTSFTCSLNTINNGDSATITVPVVISAYPAGGVSSNTATGTTFGVDTDGTNNSDTGSVNVTKSTIAGTVFNDINDNGNADGSDHGIAGVTISLSGNDSWGNAINLSTATDADGNYLFDNLPPGANYTITQTHPANYADGLDSLNGVVINGSRSSDVITNVALNANTNLTNNNFAETGLASLSGSVWRDENNNGIKEGTETTGIANITIALTGNETVSGKAISISTTTDASGNYQFTHLSAGTYVLTETQPIAWADGLEQLGSAGGIVNNDNFTNITLTANQSGTGYHFGEVGGSITGRVYRDQNNNGLIDGAEPGVSGVTIALSGTTADGFTINRSTTTDATGQYVFDGLPASNGTGYTITETQPNLILDGLDALGNLGGVLANDVLSGIVFPANGSGTGYNFGEGGDINSSISGYVYVDADDNGMRATTEAGIANVSLELTGTDRLGNAVSVTTLTDSNGRYTFLNLIASDANGYTIKESQPSQYHDGLESIGTTIITNSRNQDSFNRIIIKDGEFFTDYNFAELYQGRISGQVFFDENNNGVLDEPNTGIANVTLTLTGTTLTGEVIERIVQSDANGHYTFEQLPPSNETGYTVTQTHPDTYADGLESINNTPIAHSDLTDTHGPIVVELTSNFEHYNFAEVSNSSISGYTYTDANENGIKDANEVGIAQVTMTLTGTDKWGQPVNMTVVTDEQGFYRFTALQPSNDQGYSISQTQPNSYLDGAESINQQVLSDSSTSDVITSISLADNEQVEQHNFGEIIAASLSGSVWVDENNDGIKQASEQLGIANTTITLTGVQTIPAGSTATEGIVVTRTITTDSQGDYTFDQLTPGAYVITQNQPNAWADGKEQLGDAAGITGNDEFSQITLTSGQEALGYNFGEQGSGISGTVFSDLNDNGVKEPSESGIGQVVINLFGTDIDGNSVTRMVTTSVDGQYTFSHLPLPNSDGYTIVETQPADVIDGQDSVGSLGGTVSNDTFEDIVFNEHIVEGTDYNFAETLTTPARISGMVWLDSNHNRDEDDNNGLAGWTVQLIDVRKNAKDNTNITLIAQVTTDASGYYEFNGLSAGTYEVRFIHPQGGVIYGFPVSNEPGADLTAGTINNITLDAGEHVDEQNLPIDPSGIVYDSETRAPIQGATVVLSGPSGFDPDQDLVGGQGNVSQVTAPDGMYQFLLFDSAPSGIYTITVTEPSGYLSGGSILLPACTNTPTVLSSPNPALVQSFDTPPPASASIHDPNACPTSSADFANSDESTQYYLTFDISTELPSGNVINNHIPLDPIRDDLLHVVKTSTTKHATRGEIVPYSIRVTNSVNATIRHISLVDQLPPGFKYLVGSAKIDGIAIEPEINGRELTWQALTFAPNAQHTISLMTIIGAGAADGEYTNQAWAIEQVSQQVLTNIGTAVVRVIPDPLFDCSDITGKVFDDKNTNGYQDEGEPGIPAVRLATVNGLLITTDEHGRYHVACAAVPHESRGSNFILKVDDRTLPSGYRITTENPRVVRLTQGKVIKVNFGAAIHRVVRIQLNRDAFEQHELKADYQQSLTSTVALLNEQASILRIAYQKQGESDETINARLATLIEQIEQAHQACDCRFELLIETEVMPENANQEVLRQTRRAGHE